MKKSDVGTPLPKAKKALPKAKKTSPPLHKLPGKPINFMDHGGNIINHLLDTDNKVCRLIGADIKLEQELGKGTFGTVFQIDMNDGNGDKKFVVKKNSVDTQLVIIKKSAGQTFLNIVTKYKGDVKGILKYNGYNSDDIAAVGDKIVIPNFLKEPPCSTQMEYKRTDLKGVTIVPKGSLICVNALTEFIIGLIAGTLYQKGISINFIDIFYFATCKSNAETNQYTFMEKITTSLFKSKIQDHTIINNIYIQTIHAIGVYQKYLNLVHGDLHLDNVFISEITKDTKWGGKTLKAKDYYEYKIGKNSLYIDAANTPYLSKIGDFGLSVIYQKDKIIGDQRTLEDGYNGWLVNFYNQAYDVVYFTRSIHYFYPENEYIKEVLKWMMGIDGDLTDVKFKKEIDKYFTINNRPKQASLTTTFAHVTPLTLLTNEKLMEKFKTIPKGNGIILGYL